MSVEPVGKVALGNVVIGAVVRGDIVAEIDQRRAVINNTSRSEFVSLILEWWHKLGCPPVNTADKTLQAAAPKKRKKQVVLLSSVPDGYRTGKLISAVKERALAGHGLALANVVPRKIVYVADDSLKDKFDIIPWPGPFPLMDAVAEDRATYGDGKK